MLMPEFLPEFRVISSEKSLMKMSIVKKYYSSTPSRCSFQEGGGEKCCVWDGWVKTLRLLRILELKPLTHNISPAQHPFSPWSFQEGGGENCLPPTFSARGNDDIGTTTAKMTRDVSQIDHRHRPSKYRRIHK